MSEMRNEEWHMGDASEMAIASSTGASARDEPGTLVVLGGVLARMQVHEPSFTAVERRIATALRANGRELVGLPVEELSGRIGVSQASVVRFCRRLGYSGLREFKLSLAAEVRGDVEAIEPSIAFDDGFDAIAIKVTAAAQRALTDSLDVLDRSVLEQATEALVGAGRIQIFGVGGSAPIAQDAHYRFARLGLPVSVQTDAHLQPVVAARLGSDTVAFVVSHTGRSREPVHVIEEAKRAGATTILLTSFANTPAARWADHVLLTAAGATTPWGGMAPLRVAQLTVIDMLCVAIAGREDAELQQFRARYDAMEERRMLPVDTVSANPFPAVIADPPARPFTHLSPSAEAQVSDRHHQRRVRIDGVPNTRHLGGIPLKNGGETAPVVFRSGALWQITKSGIRQMQELGISHIVDLRYGSDLETHATPSLDDYGITNVRAPFYELADEVYPDLDDRAGWVAMYRAWAEQSRLAMATVIETIAQAEGAVLLHCHLGVDRSGIVSALLLDLVGVDEADILADYRMSPSGPGYEHLISAVLERIRERYGSTWAFFKQTGTTDRLLSRVQARMTRAESARG
jgi:DNA-binding MurR/RpiR family transcriptional regulator